jgi:hypothetical protein
VADGLNGGTAYSAWLDAKGLLALNNTVKAIYTRMRPGFWPIAAVKDLWGFLIKMPDLRPKLKDLPAALRRGDWAALANYLPGAVEVRKLAAIGVGHWASGRAMAGKPNALAKAARHRQWWGARRDSFGRSEREDEFEHMLVEYGRKPGEWGGQDVPTKARLLRALEWWSGGGQFSEQGFKAAGGWYLDQFAPQLSEGEKRRIVHEAAGSPDFWQRAGGSAMADTFAMTFYNAFKEGHKAHWHAVREHPLEYGWRQVKYTTIPSAALGALAMGWVSKWLRARGADDEADQVEEFEQALLFASQYDREHYFCVPQRWVLPDGTMAPIDGSHVGDAEKRGWRVLYVRFALDENQMLGHKAMQKAVALARGEAGWGDFMSVAGGQLPTGSPIIQVAIGFLSEAMGGTAVDWATGRPVIQDPRVRKAGGWAVTKAMAKWAWNELGGSIVYRFGRESRPEDLRETKLDRFLAAPVVGDIVGRWVKVSDQGRRDRERVLAERVAKTEAEGQLEVSRAVVEIIRADRSGGTWSEGLADRMLTDAEFRNKVADALATAQTKAGATPLERTIMDPASKRVKIGAMERYLDGER